MKKVLVIFLALIIGLSMSAQIQNKILGFTLGETTKSEVYNKYKNEPLFVEDESGILGIGGLQFAGQVWDIVSFEFENNSISASMSNEGLKINFKIKNIGNIEGEAVPMVFLKFPDGIKTEDGYPDKLFKGFD